MQEWTPSEAERRAIFEADIVPALFPPVDVPSSPRPTLVLLGGQPGAGKSRATSRILLDNDAGMVALSGDDLRAFHPHYRELARTRSVDAPAILAETTAEWVRDRIVHARESGRSLLLEGAFHTPAIVIGTAERFAEAGFDVRLVVIAAPRADSLLTVTSRYLRDRQSGVPARFTTAAVHDRGFAGTRDVVAHGAASEAIRRLTVLNRAGETVFDHERGTDASTGTFADALTPFDAARAERPSNRAAVAWLGELKRMTEYAVGSRQLSRPLGDLLIDLHEVALRDVIPAMPLPTNSSAGAQLEGRVAQDLIALRLALRPEGAVDASGPVVSGPVRDGAGPSR